MTTEDPESLNETLHALCTPDFVEQLRQADADYAAGKSVSGEDLRRLFDLG